MFIGDIDNRPCSRQLPIFLSSHFLPNRKTDITFMAKRGEPKLRKIESFSSKIMGAQHIRCVAWLQRLHSRWCMWKFVDEPCWGEVRSREAILCTLSGPPVRRFSPGCHPLWCHAFWTPCLQGVVRAQDHYVQKKALWLKRAVVGIWLLWDSTVNIFFSVPRSIRSCLLSPSKQNHGGHPLHPKSHLGPSHYIWWGWNLWGAPNSSPEPTQSYHRTFW